ncbi:hypothetical protein ABZS59_36275 [Streptomyces flaveolus]|jgi:hypothetical protein|uniref:hypothetical protein n=1 Tax=Streptomyces flaveolus TaxID=67297 RepID=UPI0033AAA798
MSTEHLRHATVKHWQDCTDVYDFLEQIRLRPGMWLPSGQLRDLQLILIGYRVALGVHSIDEPFAFWPEADFTRWLREKHGISSSLGWAAEIESRTTAETTPVDEFFRLLDGYRRDIARDTPPRTEA